MNEYFEWEYTRKAWYALTEEERKDIVEGKLADIKRTADFKARANLVRRYK